MVKPWNVEEFDQATTPYYIGKVVKGDLKDNHWFYATGGGVGPKFGQNDFRVKYLDAGSDRNSTDPQADQVHHFAAYFSAGINGAYWTTTAHATTDGAMYRSAESVYKGGWPTYANQGDIDLGNDAYALGVEVKKNPELLKTIGSTIRSRFCL